MRHADLLEKSHYISFSIAPLTRWTWHAANRQRMGLGGPMQTGGWHQPEGGRGGGGREIWTEGRQRDTGERKRERERERWQNDAETTQNRKWLGQVFGERGETAIKQTTGVATTSHFYALRRIQRSPDRTISETKWIVLVCCVWLHRARA